MSKKDFKQLSDPAYIKKINKESSKYSKLVNLKKKRKQTLDQIYVPGDFIKVFLDFKNFKFEYTEKIRTRFISPKLKGWKKRIMTAYNKYRDKFGLDDDAVYGNMKKCNSSTLSHVFLTILDGNEKTEIDIFWADDRTQGFNIAREMSKGFEAGFLGGDKSSSSCIGSRGVWRDPAKRKQLWMEKIIEPVFNVNPLDHDFIVRLSKTQLFTHYAEQRFKM